MKARLLFFAAVLSVPTAFASNLSSGFFNIEQVNNGSDTFQSVAQFSVSNTQSGFINVSDGTNWLVQNLWVGLDSGFSQTTTRMDLSTLGISNGFNASPGSYGLYVTQDATPLASLGAVLGSGSLQGGLSITEMELDLGETDPGGPPTNGVFSTPGGVSFSGTGFSIDYQFGHPNVQASVNQCAPAAVANSLAWLAATYPTNIYLPNANVQGNRTDTPENNSLVGQLEAYMNRLNINPLNPRLTGSGVWPLDGKLQYLGANGLGGLTVSHQTEAVGGNAGANNNLTGNGNYTSGGVTSNAKGAPSWDFLQKEIAHGEDVEFDIVFPCIVGGVQRTCRHYVNATGAGSVLGSNWITHVSDFNQRDDTKGTNRIDFDWVVSNSTTGRLELPRWGTFANGQVAYIDQIITESVPEPGTIGLMILAIGTLVAKRRRAA